jgi:hypothetical protein
MRRAAAFALALSLAVGVAACASHDELGRRAGRDMPEPDSVTIGLWHMDESGGTGCADAGRYGLQGTAGLDTHTDFGRFANARVFSASNESWVFVPFSDAMNASQLTVEAWIEPTAYGTAEDTPIACRWSEYNTEQSWLFGIVGLQRDSRLAGGGSPGFHDRFVNGAAAMHLMFTFQPSEPGPPQTYYSTAQIPLGRWTHVAVTHDGGVVRFWIDGQLDSQFATRTTIRAGGAPLLVGNYIDTRRLTSFSGDLRLGSGGITYAPLYAFRGMIDELRLSNVARELGPGR